MGLMEMQVLLARLYVDGAARAEFFADPRAAAARFGISPDEAASLSQREVEFFARSLKLKRLGEVSRLLPRTRDLLGSRFRELFLQYAEQPMRGGTDKHRVDAVCFVEFLLRADVPRSALLYERLLLRGKGFMIVGNELAWMWRGRMHVLRFGGKRPSAARSALA